MSVESRDPKRRALGPRTPAVRLEEVAPTVPPIDVIGRKDEIFAAIIEIDRIARADKAPSTWQRNTYWEARVRAAKEKLAIPLWGEPSARHAGEDILRGASGYKGNNVWLEGQDVLHGSRNASITRGVILGTHSAISDSHNAMIKDSLIAGAGALDGACVFQTHQVTSPRQVEALVKAIRSRETGNEIDLVSALTEFDKDIKPEERRKIAQKIEEQYDIESPRRRGSEFYDQLMRHGDLAVAAFQIDQIFDLLPRAAINVRIDNSVVTGVGPAMEVIGGEIKDSIIDGKWAFLGATVHVQNSYVLANHAIRDPRSFISPEYIEDAYFVKPVLQGVNLTPRHLKGLSQLALPAAKDL